jgi:hypothetical protein
MDQIFRRVILNAVKDLCIRSRLRRAPRPPKEKYRDSSATPHNDALLYVDTPVCHSRRLCVLLAAVRMNLARYYRIALPVDRLKKLGGFAATFSRQVFRMMLLRRLSALARKRGAAVCVCCALTMSGHAADSTHVRTRRAAQSAGVTESHGKFAAADRTETRRARRHAQPVSQATPSNKDGSTARGSKGQAKARAAAPPKKSESGGTAVAKRRRRQRVIEVEQPVPMSHAALRREKRRDAREEITAKKNDVSEGAAAKNEVARSDAAKKPVTVDDFVRAANGGSLPGEAKPVAAQGVSKPDETELIETSDADATPVPAQARPKMIARPSQRAPAVAAKVSVPTAAKNDMAKNDMAKSDMPRSDMAKSDGPAMGVAFADAPTAADLPTQRVVDGFGGEVALLPGKTVVRGGLSKKNAPPDELASGDKTLQRELADDAMKPVVVPLYTRLGKLITPAPLKGTHEILVHQNLMADQEGLARIQDDSDLNRMRAAHLLLPLPDIAALEINEELPYNRRYARPWTVKFVADIAHAYYAKFHDPLRLSSAVRTVDFQRKLQRVNGNAAAIEGETASPHLTGQAIDFGKGGMTREEIAWMRAYLGPVMGAGKIDVEEEFQQACFHISVYASYAPKKTLRQDVAEVR